MLCPKGGHFVKIWWLDYYRAGKWASTLEKQPFCEMYILILFDVVSKRWALC